MARRAAGAKVKPVKKIEESTPSPLDNKTMQQRTDHIYRGK